MYGTNLKNLRHERKLTQKEVSDYIEKSVQAYSQYELEKRSPDLDTLCMLADFYGVSTDVILGRIKVDLPPYFDANIQETLSEKSLLKIQDYIDMLCKLETLEK